MDNNLGNPNLKPEMKTEWEIGTDLRFFDNMMRQGFHDLVTPISMMEELESVLINRPLDPMQNGR